MLPKLRTLGRSCDFALARRRLIRSGDLAANELSLLERVNLDTHLNDTMYVRYAGQQYLTAGLSAMRCIEAALNGKRPGRILDFPCGYGRVLRFLKIRFPESKITACDIDPEAVKFCQTFGVNGVPSNVELTIDLPNDFDLIWCGSLVTHLNRPRVAALLRFFSEHLSTGATCVFSAHGEQAATWMQDGTQTCGLSEAARWTALDGYRRTGFGYVDYDGQAYGISLTSKKVIEEMAAHSGDWHETSFLEHGWDGFHDVYGFTKGHA